MKVKISLLSCAASLLLLFSYPALSECGCGSNDPANACTGNSVEYSRDGRNIQFEFSCDGGVCACGKFANDWDFWVAPQTPGGQVTITRMLPEATNVGTSNVRNGAQADALRMVGQAFTTHGEASMSMERVDNGMSVSAPHTVSPAQLGRPTVILKSVSDTGGRCNDSDRVCLDYVETLTILEEPPGNVFRPPFYGTEKPLIPASDFDPSNLPSLPAVGGAMSWDEALATTLSVNVREYISQQNRRQGMTATVNNQVVRGYEQYVNLQQISALLKLTENAQSAGDRAKKRQLALQIAQRGIDLYFIHKNGWGENWNSAVNVTNGPCGAWVGAGGFGGGKLVPILYAASLLDRRDWVSTVNSNIGTPAGRQCFAETGFIQPAGNTGKAIALFGHLSNSLYSVTCSGNNRNCADISGVCNGKTPCVGRLTDFAAEADGDPLGDSGAPTAYQRCCTHGAWLGSALAVWLNPAVRNSFPENASHFLEYMERTRSLGVEVNADFGIYADKNSWRITGFNASGYDSDHYYALWDRYKDCSDAGSCPGMQAGPTPTPPLGLQ